MNGLTRVSQRQLQEISLKLGQRNKEILATIQKCRYITSKQIERLYFNNSTSQDAAVRASNRNLKTLKDYGLIETLRRRIGGSCYGSAPGIWAIKPAGVKLLRLINPDNRMHFQTFAPSPFFAEHTIITTESYVQLIELSREANIELAKVEFEPECWRYSIDYHGKKNSYKPDLYAIVRSGGYEDHYFLEIDLATESPSTIIEKCERCLLYRKAGIEQKRNGVFPYVVWIVPHDRRKSNIKRYITAHYTKMPDVFVVITPDELEALITEGVDKYRQKATQKGATP